MKVMRMLRCNSFNENSSPIPLPSLISSHSSLLTPHSSLLSYHFSLLISLFSLLLSCQSAPKTPDIFPDDAKYLPLEPGARAYIVTDVPNAQPILTNLNFVNNINNEQFQQMVDRTRFIAAAVYQAENLRSYRLAAWGDYPSSRAKMALGASKDWKKQRSPITGDNYWYSAQGAYAVALSTGRAFVSAAVGNTPDTPPVPIDPFSAAPGTAIPEGFNEFRRGAVFSCWIDNPGPGINQKLMEMGIPLEIPAQQLFVSLFSVDEQRYEARLKIQVAGETQARALATLFSLARGFLSFSAPSDSSAILGSILFANPPVQDGNALNITTAPLSVKDISLLFTMFSL